MSATRSRVTAGSGPLRRAPTTSCRVTIRWLCGSICRHLQNSRAWRCGLTRPPWSGPQTPEWLAAELCEVIQRDGVVSFVCLSPCVPRLHARYPDSNRLCRYPECLPTFRQAAVLYEISDLEWRPGEDLNL